MSVSERFVAVMAVALAFLLIAFGITGGAPRQEPEMCADDETREMVRALALEAIDDAFKKHMMLLFEIWLKDYTEEPKRAIAGNQINISAYLRSRALTLKWNLPPCVEGRP